MKSGNEKVKGQHCFNRNEQVKSENKRVKNYVNIRPERLISYRLEPQESRTVQLHTLPESGAFYPLDMVFRRQRVQPKIGLR